MEQFPLSQFLITRLEDFDADPRGYLRRIYGFLGLREPSESEWVEILIQRRFNANKMRHEPMRPETDDLLREFYAPFNNMLASILMDSRYTWRDDRRSMEAKNNLKSDTIGDVAADQAVDVPSPTTAPTTPAVAWTPGTFDTTDLPQGSSRNMTDWLLRYIDPDVPPRDAASAGKQLALAIIALDVPAVKYLLKDVGVPATLVADEEFQQPPVVSLALVGSLAEGHSRSHVFRLLKGERSWLSDLMQPQLPDLMHSVHSKDITDSLNEAVLNVSTWLIRAGADLNATDAHGYR